MTTNNPTTTSTDDDWLTYYHQINQPTTAAPFDGGSLTPKGNLSKPIRRRSRASKKTPTTVLNTSPNNFRALVQQFTGCPTRRPGPIHLSFTGGSVSPQQDVSVSTINNSSSSSTVVHCFDHHHNQDDQLLNYHHQAQHRLQNDTGFTAGEATGYADSNMIIAAGEAEFGTDLDEIASVARDHVLF